MFKALKDNKIIAIAEKKEIVIHNEDGDIIQEIIGEALFPCLVYDEIIEDIEHTCDEFKCYGDEFTLIDIEKDNEIAKQNRASAYALEVDPITAHIQRLKDENPIPEGEIAELIAEREAKVQEIKERFPYSEVKDDII